MSEVEKKIYVGIDVSKAYLDVYIRPTEQTIRVSNDKTGIKELLKFLVNKPIKLIVLEATGGYEKMVARNLEKENFPINIINPRQARDFAKALGQLAKTDKVDSRMLALFADKVEPIARPLKTLEQQELVDLKVRRKQLVEMITMEKNRLDKASPKIKKEIDKIIKFLEKEIKAIEGKLSKAIENDKDFSRKDQLLRSIKGVGRISSAALLADLPELGTLSHKKISSLVGLAPFNRDSGIFVGGRTIWGGRSSVRTTLYMVALVAAKTNPQIKLFYDRLCKAGKAKKVALTACMHKLLMIMNAIIKSDLPWKMELKNA